MSPTPSNRSRAQARRLFADRTEAPLRGVHWREVVKCRACALHKQCTQPVPGIGTKHPQLLLVGRNPGKLEDKWIAPFVGPAGERLTQVLHEVGVQRSDCYITNIVKCFTEGNRKPPQPCIQVCANQWLLRELSAVRPDLIVLLGQDAQRGFVDVHGRRTELMRQAWPEGTPVPPLAMMVHPSAALRAPIFEAMLRKQTRKLAQLLDSLAKGRARGDGGENTLYRL